MDQGSKPTLQERAQKMLSLQERELLFIAAMGDVKRVEALLESGVDVNVVDSYGRTALHTACIGGYTEVVKLLLSKGANPNAVTLMGKTALHTAMSSHNTLQITKILLDKGVDVNIQDVMGFAPIHIALYRKNEGAIKILLPHTNTNLNLKQLYNMTLLHMAVTLNEPKLVKILLPKYKSIINEPDDLGMTPLYYACLAQSLSMVQLLAANGANVNTMLNNALTPARLIVLNMCAVLGIDKESYNKLVKILGFLVLGCGARIDIELPCTQNVQRCLGVLGIQDDRPGDMTATDYDVVFISIDELLHDIVDNGSIFTRLYYWLFKYPTHNMPIINFDIKEGVVLLDSNTYAYATKPFEEFSSGQMCAYINFTRGATEAIEEWLRGGGDINIQDYEGMSVLHNACYEKDLERIKALLQVGIQVNLKDNAGNTALHIACYMQSPVEVIKLLLQHKANINDVNKGGATAMHMLFAQFVDDKKIDKAWRAEVIKLFLENGADTSIKDIFGVAVCDMFEIIDGQVVVEARTYQEVFARAYLLEEAEQNAKKQAEAVSVLPQPESAAHEDHTSSLVKGQAPSEENLA